MRRLFVTGLAATALAITPVLAQSALADESSTHSASVAPGGVGTYVAVTPTRLLDSRTSGGKLAAGGTRSVKVTGRAGIPAAGVSAAVVNLTVTSGTRPGFLSAYPGGTAFSGTSALNFAAGETRANLATVPVGADGTITVLNGGGAGTAAAHVLVDVQGYYLSSSAEILSSEYFTTDPERVLDTRLDGGPLGPGEITNVDLYSDEDGPVDVDFSDVRALAVNLTAVNPTKPGFLVAYDGVSDEPPTTSNLNFTPGKITPNNTVVPVSYDEFGEFSVLEFAIGNGAPGFTNVLADVVGVYAEENGGLIFKPLSSPVRMVDTRSGKGASKFGPNQTQTVSATSDVLDPALPFLTGALVGNLTAVRSTAATYLTVWPEGSRPTVSNLNPAVGQTVANHAYFGLASSESGKSFNVYNNAGSTDVLVDVTGRFDFEGVGVARTGKSAATPKTFTFSKATRSSHRSAR